MRRSRRLRLVSLLGAGTLLFGACAAGASPSPSAQTAASQPAASQPAASASEPGGSASAGASASPEGSASAAPAASLPGTKEFSVAFTSLGMSSAPFLAAIDDLNQQGYTIDTPELAESELVTQGVASGEFAFGSGANNSTMTAVEAGANLKLLVNRVNNEWTIYARTDIADCAGLAGKKLA